MNPKANNILITSNGPVMIDWDTVRLGPPTRDLWMIGGHQRYTALTGRVLPSEQLDFYRLRWDLADLCSSGSWFCRPHEATADTDSAGTVRLRSASVCPPALRGRPGLPKASRRLDQTINSERLAVRERLIEPAGRGPYAQTSRR